MQDISPNPPPQTTVKKRKSIKTPMMDSYQDVEKMIYGLVHNHVRKHGGDFDELMGECNLAFTQAYHSYNPTKSKFSTWIYWAVSMTLLEVLRKNGKASRVKMMQREELVDYSEKPQKNHTISRLKDLSDDAKLVAYSIVNPNLDMKIMLKKMGIKHTPKRLNFTVREFLQELGWDEKKIEKTFKEIASNI